MSRHFLLALTLILAIPLAGWTADTDEAIRKAATFYASFDEAVKGDAGGGGLELATRFNHETEKGQFVFDKSIDSKLFRAAKDKGIQGGALECTGVLPRNGRIFFPAKGNLAFKKGGWGGALSVWINTDADKLLQTKFCDPIQITQKGANNGGIWFDFNDAKPRDLRHGAFPAVAEGKTPIKEEDPKAPMVRVPKVGLKQGDWHHVVLSWKNFDTGKDDAVSALYIDGKLIGEVKDRAIAMDWDVEKAGIYVAVNYIGLLDELALFGRALTAEEVTQLHKEPGLLAPLKKAKKPSGAFRDLSRKYRALAEAKSTDPADWEAFRESCHKFLDTEEGRTVAEAVLTLLLVAPRSGALPPAPPKFPFDAETARRYQHDYAAATGMPVEFVNGQGMTFVFVPPGRFLMGSPEDEPGRKEDESQHAVRVTRPFYLAKHEVTVGQFRRFVEPAKYVTDGEKNGGGHAHDAKAVWEHRAGVSWKKPGYAGPFTMTDEHPVVHVSHTDSMAFCGWLKEQAGLGAKDFWDYTLPTEAQWEWACRAGSGSRFWWGGDEDTTGKVVNAGDRTLKKVHPEWPRVIMPMDDGHAFAAPVGSYKPNAFGLHDMLGNVWEFCSTRSGPYPKEPSTDPGNLDPKRGFAVRGGGWSNVPADVRCATRNADPPHFCHSNLGFRVALVLPAR